MEGNVEAPRAYLPRFKVMGLPMNLSVEFVSSGIKMPASNADDGIVVLSIDDFHVANCRITKESRSLFGEMVL